MAVGVVNHDNCILHIAELKLLPGMNELRSSDADRLAEHPRFDQLVMEGRIELLQTRGNRIRSSDPGGEGDQRNFAMERFGNLAQEHRLKSVLDNPDQMKAQYIALQARMSPTQAKEYIANSLGLNAADVSARLDA